MGGDGDSGLAHSALPGTFPHQRDEILENRTEEDFRP